MVKVWGRVIGPGWRLRRGLGSRESVLERKPCRRRELGCGMRMETHTDTKEKWSRANGERTPIRKKTSGMYTGEARVG